MMKMCLCCSDEEDEDRIPEGLPPKVVEVYKSVGKIMSRYKAGKVPKAFKIIPNLKNWEEVGFLPIKRFSGLQHSLSMFRAVSVKCRICNGTC